MTSERELVDARAGDAEAQNLIVVGLFESLQGQSDRDGAHDLVERSLGPVGVRTVDAWRRFVERK